ncbi:MAG TPA: LON peptidase substrate-binding domain-containing protein [Gaiellaceae bacterium]|nr:LON peptidase substrate-binding domain-containing protein [Gaiellaceae bacterium]
MTELGLFPLPLVLLPTERIPLHIFEERYRELIGECLDSDGEFGFVYADDDGVRDVGTRAHVTEVLARLDDGRMDVLVEGGERFRLLELTTGRSFHTGVVARMDDEDDPADRQAVERALGLFDRLRELTRSEVDVPEAGESQLSYLLASRIEFAPTEKLELLNDVSERSRMTRLCDLLEIAIETAQHVRGAAERAATNGRVHLS